MKDKVSGNDLMTIREQAATNENYAIICRNNTDRITKEYLALQVEIVRLRKLISDYVNASNNDDSAGDAFGAMVAEVNLNKGQ